MMSEYMGYEAIHHLELAETFTSLSCDVDDLKQDVLENCQLVGLGKPARNPKLLFFSYGRLSYRKLTTV